MPPRKRTRKQRLDPKRPPFDPWKGPAEDLEELFERTRQLAGIHDALLAEYRNNSGGQYGRIDKVGVLSDATGGAQCTFVLRFHAGPSRDEKLP